MPAKKCEVRLRPRAEADLEKIGLYTFKHWSVEQADKYISDLAAKIEHLARGDKIGYTCSVRGGCFLYAVGSHILFYRMTPITLDITRVLHQRMDVERHL